VLRGLRLFERIFGFVGGFRFLAVGTFGFSECFFGNFDRWNPYLSLHWNISPVKLGRGGRGGQVVLEESFLSERMFAELA
jgi:hypothetical protein